MLKRKKYRREWLFLMFVIGMAVFKQILTCQLPIFADPSGVHDDGIMVRTAQYLRNGQWLGPYDELTLVKGMFFPLFLATCNFLKISYLSASTLFYTAGCVLFTYGVRPVIKSYKGLAALYFLLLWNPVSYATETFQRVYRSSIGQAQVLFIFGCFFALYLRREKRIREQMVWLTGAVIGLVSFWFTREDAIWIMPFTCVLMLVYLGNIFFLYRKTKMKSYFIKAIIICLPVICLWGTGKVIGSINQKYYGTSVVNELTGSNFGAMIKTMYSVKNEEIYERVSVSQEKLERMCEVSPTLATLAPFIEHSKAVWSGGTGTEWEIKDGWFFWILRSAMSEAGYFSDAATADALCVQIKTELEEALDAGLLEPQSTMPSALMSPWRSEYPGKIFEAMGEAVAYSLSLKDLETGAPYSTLDSEGGVRRFEKITGNAAICNNAGAFVVSGWYIYKEGMDGITLQFENKEGIVLKEIELLESIDVEAYLQQEGTDIDGSDQCRFKENFMPENPVDELFFCAYDSDGKLITRQAVSEEQMGMEDDSQRLQLDLFWEVPEQRTFVEAIQWKINALNGITQIYQALGVPTGIMGLLAYFLISWRIFRENRNRIPGKKPKSVEIWLILTALLASYFVLLGGISYTHISAFKAINNTYLSASYPIITAFVVIGVTKVLEEKKWNLQS